jgi:hypothetical protein
MVQPQYSPQEALERVKLMMKYDTSKTLNENREIIFEQASTPGGIPQKAVDKIIAISKKNKETLRGSSLFPSQQQSIDAEFGTGTYSKFFYDGGEDILNQTPTSPSSSTKEEGIASLFYDDGAKGPGTNPDEMLSAIKQINSADLFWKVNDLVKTKSGGMDIAGVINDEFESGNYKYITEIINWLKGIKINANADMYSNSWKIRSFKITTKPAESKSDDTPTPTTDPYSKFPCVKKHRKAVKGKDVDGNDIYTINGVVYYGNGRKRLSNGTMANYTCNDPEFKGKSKPVAIPDELIDAEGVMKFQDWLDTNAAGWATGYKDGIIKKGENGGGYGKFGPRTQKAWNNPTYKDGYLKSLQTPTESTPIEDTDSVEIEDKDPNKL